jgi:hypothetical protein
MSVETSGSAPTFTALANAGDTATTTGSAGNDTAGEIVLNAAGSGRAAGSVVTVTFAQARPDTSYVVILQEFSSSAVTLGRVRTSLTSTTWNLIVPGTPSDATTYRWHYWVVEY